uniref:Spaetzle domain-containing protein n=1 Tax=Globodera pallida TaxID=36090 RepID=A0A183CCF7_GLOPA
MYDVSGVFRFLDKTITDQYERQSKPPKSNDQAVKRNVEALERLLSELNLRCDVRSPEVLSRLGNLTMNESKRSIISPSLRHQQKEDQLLRHKRNSVLAEQLVHQRLRAYDEPPGRTVRTRSKKQKIIGDVHAVPFGCDKRGDSEDGYLRLCGACQAIRKLPDEFFPPFINEVVCDEDKACLYFYDYPHGKCKQKHMNFVVLKNVGTPQCQIWEKFNLNVRVSCECFVDEMSFFSKYV